MRARSCLAACLGLLLVALASVPALAAGSGGQVRYLLALPGIPGDSTTKGHEGAVLLSTFSETASLTQFRSGTSPADHQFAGPPNFKPMLAVKEINAASPALFLAMSQTRVMPTVRLDLLGTKPDGSDYTLMTFTLTNVVISGIRYFADPDSHAPCEELTLDFTGAAISPAAAGVTTLRGPAFIVPKLAK